MPAKPTIKIRKSKEIFKHSLMKNRFLLSDMNSFFSSGISEQSFAIHQNANLSFQTPLNGISPAMATLTSDAVIADGNKNLSKMLKKPLKKMLRTPFMNFVAKEDIKRFKTLFQAGLRKGFEGEIHLNICGRKKLLVLISGYPFSLEKSKGICLVLNDLSKINAAQLKRQKLSASLDKNVSERTRALAKSEERLILAQQAAGAGVWDWDIATNQLEWSKEFYILFGIDHAKTKPSFDVWRSVLYPDDRKIAEERISAAIKDHTPLANEYRIICPDTGKIRWINALGNTTYDESNKPQRMMGICIDITARKKIEETLRWSEQRQHMLSESSTYLLASADPQSVIDQVCRKTMEFLDCQIFFNFLSVPERNKLRLNAYAGIPESDARLIEWLDYGVAVCGSVARKGKRIIAEHILDKKDARTSLVRKYGTRAYCCHPLQCGNDVIGTLSFGTTNRDSFSDREISMMEATASIVSLALQRKQSEDALRESEERFRLAQASASVGIWDWYPRTNAWSCSVEFETLYGLPPGTTKTYQDWQKRIHPDDISSVEIERDEAIAEHRSFNLEFRIFHKSGEILWHTAKGKAIYDEAGEVLRVLGIIMDITHSKQLEKNLNESHTAVLTEKNRLEVVMKTLPVGMAICDTQGGTIQSNREFEKIWGTTRPLPRSFDDYTAYKAWWLQTGKLVQPEEWASAQVIQTGKPITGQMMEIERFNGSRAIVINSAAPIIDENNKITGSVVIIQDITEHKILEEKVAHLASFPELNPNPICEISLNGDIKYLNPSLRQAFPEIERNGIKHPWFIDLLSNVIPEITKTAGKSTIRDIKIGGSYFAQSISHLPERNCIRIYGIDITKRKLIEEKLAQEQDNLQKIFNTVNLGMLLIDENHLVKHVNNVIGRWANKNPETLRDERPGNILRCIHAFENTMGCGHCTQCHTCLIHNTIDSVLKSGQPIHNLEVEMIFSVDGSQSHHWFELNADPIQMNGKPHVVLALDDIDHRKRAEQELNENRKDLNRAQAVAHVGSWRLNIQRNELTWSDENHRIFGIPKGPPLTYETFLSTVHPDDRKYVDKKWKAALLGAPYDIEHRIVTDNTVKWVREKACLEFDKQGRLSGGFGTTEDITEQKHIEAILKEQKEEFQIIFDSVQAMIFFKDKDNHFIRTNKAFEDTMGLSKENLVGRSVFDLYPKDQADAYWKDDKEVINSGKPKRGIIEILTTPRGTRLVQTDKIPYRDGEGTIIGVIGFAVDITQLRNAERKHSTILETAQSGYLLFDLHGKLTEVNDAYCRMSGYSRQELLKMHLNDLEAHGNRKETLGRIKLLCEQKHLQYETRHRRKDGSIFDADVRTSYLDIEESMMVVFVWDITERKQVEAILKRDKDTFENLVKQRTDELLAMRFDLERAKHLSDIGALAATVAHELRTPLGVVRIATYNMRQKNPAPQFEKHIMHIEKKISEADQIINNLLSFSRIKTPHLEQVMLSDLLEECIKTTSRRFAEQKIRIDKNLAPLKKYLIEIDPLQMKEVFNNILTNAYEAVAAKKGRIKIITAIDKTRRQISIRFEDNGVGIPEEYLEKIHEPFFTTKSKGTGLGLAVCQQIIHNHHGKIEVKSKKNKGTVFTIILPDNPPKNL